MNLIATGDVKPGWYWAIAYDDRSPRVVEVAFEDECWNVYEPGVEKPERLDQFRFLERLEVPDLTKATWISISNWWDGPLTGAVRLLDGSRAWARCISGDTPGTRVYELLDLTEASWAKHDERHALWLECCGNYAFDKPPGWAPTKPIEEFYRSYPTDSPDSYIDGVPIMTLDAAELRIPETEHAMHGGGSV